MLNFGSKSYPEKIWYPSFFLAAALCLVPGPSKDCYLLIYNSYCRAYSISGMVYLAGIAQLIFKFHPKNRASGSLEIFFVKYFLLK